MPKHELYSTWRGMISRCHNPKATSFETYGGRGIIVCDRWRQFFTAFIADMGPRPAGCTLDRIDGAGNYEPGNVRWATKQDQAINRRGTKLITFEGHTRTLSEWARRFRIDDATVRDRIERGWSLNSALKTPPDCRFSPHEKRENVKQTTNSEKPRQLAV